VLIKDLASGVQQTVRRERLETALRTRLAQPRGVGSR